MEYIEYKKELLKNQKVVDAISNGDLSVCTMIDELYKLGYKIEKFDVTHSSLTLPDAKEIVIFAEEESDRIEKSKYTKYDKTSYMFGLMDGARWIKEKLKK